MTKPWVARSGLSKQLVAALQSSLFELQDRDVLKTIKRSGFLPATDSDYDMIREAMSMARQFDVRTIRVATYAAEKPTRVFAKLHPYSRSWNGAWTPTAGMSILQTVSIPPMPAP